MKILLVLFLLIIMNIQSDNRPTNHWQIRFDDNREILLEANSFAEAVEAFQKQNPKTEIHSVSRYSFVATEWIWIDTETDN